MLKNKYIYYNKLILIFYAGAVFESNFFFLNRINNVKKIISFI